MAGREALEVGWLLFLCSARCKAADRFYIEGCLRLHQPVSVKLSSNILGDEAAQIKDHALVVRLRSTWNDRPANTGSVQCKTLSYTGVHISKLEIASGLCFKFKHG